MNAVHPYSDAQALVYSPPYSDSTHHHRPSFHPSMSASPWSPPPHTLLPSSTADHSRMYSLMQPIHTMPYSAPSPAVFYNHHHHSNQHQPRMQLSTPVPLNFTGPQIESNIGPQRGVLTRRQARAAQLRGTSPSAHQENAESTSPSECHDVRTSLATRLNLISQLNYCHPDAYHPNFAVAFADAR
jgi:hypothetical protein